MSKKEITVFSFGAGVQSTAIMLLMMHEPWRVIEAMGRLPDCMIFADTGAEVSAVYEHLKWVRENAPIDFVEVNNGSILDGENNGAINRSFVPLFTRGGDGKASMLLRKCTNEFKISPIQRYARKLAGLKKGEKGKKHQIKLWLGISTDEAIRMKDNRSPTFKNEYPLIELKLSRQDCYQINKKYGVGAPKSRCFMCPYTSNWGDVRRNHPKDWEKAVQFDREIRDITDRGGTKNKTYLHRTLQPLEDAVVDQGDIFDGFITGCEGFCGL